MTIVVATRDRMVSDSHLNWGNARFSVGKIFRRSDGALYATAGDLRLTYPFEAAMQDGHEPVPLEVKEEEAFEGVLLMPNGDLFVYDENFSPSKVGNPWVCIGGDQDVARSWMLHGFSAEIAVERVIEVDEECGGDVVTVLLHEPAQAPRRKR